MVPHLRVETLLEYTEWERGLWKAFFAEHGGALTTGVGPNADERFAIVGDLVRHIFSAETRYVERLSGLELTDTSGIPATDPGALFRLGDVSRSKLRAFLASYPAGAWDVAQDLSVGKHSLTATPRKILLHVLVHEIRHWAQIATLLRLQGMTGSFHDLLFSPVLSGGPA